MPKFYYIPDSDSLLHHGVKGQKHGVRRYQNQNGTWTEEGKARRRLKSPRQLYYEIGIKNNTKAYQRYISDAQKYRAQEYGLDQSPNRLKPGPASRKADEAQKYAALAADTAELLCRKYEKRYGAEKLNKFLEDNKLKQSVDHGQSYLDTRYGRNDKALKEFLEIDEYTNKYGVDKAVEKYGKDTVVRNMFY